jgi:hypothetical protein
MNPYLDLAHRWALLALLHESKEKVRAKISILA